MRAARKYNFYTDIKCSADSPSRTTIALMPSSSSLRRFTASLLMAAVLLQALLPLLGLHGGPAKRDNWIEICAGSGIQWVKLSDADKSAPAASAHADSPCVFCIAGTPPERFDAHAYLMPAAGRKTPAIFHHDPPLRQFAGHPLRARAPPLLA